VPGIARYLLSAIRTINGAAGLVAPRLVAGKLGATPENDAAALYPLRLFGVRTVLLGVELLSRNPEVRRHAVNTAVLIHATDTVSAALGGLRGELPRSVSARLTILSGLNTGLALLARRSR
jgi:hypothetical protein